MRKVLMISLFTFMTSWGLIGGGFQGGIISPSDLDVSFYVGGHLNALEMIPKLVLWIPAEYWHSSKEHTYSYSRNVHKNIVDDYSAAAQARYCFEGLVGPFAGGGLRMHRTESHYSDRTPDGLLIREWYEYDTILGLDLVGGYAFSTGGMLITPEACFQVGGYDSFKLGVDFTFR